MNPLTRGFDRVLGIERAGALRGLAYGLAEHRLQPMSPLNYFPTAEYVPLFDGSLVDTTDCPRIGDEDFPFPVQRSAPTRTPDTAAWLLPRARWLSGIGGVTDGKHFVDGCLRYPLKYTPLKSRRWLEYPVQRVDGVCIGLEGDFATTHYHQLMDLLPRVALLQHPYFQQFEQITLMSAQYAKSAELRYLVDALLPTNVRVLETAPNTLVEPDLLIMPVGVMDTWVSIPNRWYVDILRATFAKNRTTAPQRRIFISRAGARARRLLNENEVVRALSKFDFEVIRTEKLTVAQVIELMSDIEIVVSLLGSGLANAVFCAPPTRMLEIASAAGWSIDYYGIAKGCDLRFATVEAAPQTSHVPRWHGHQHRMLPAAYYRRRDADLIVDTDELCVAVDKLLDCSTDA